MKRRFKKIISLLTIPILLISMILNNSILKEVKAADLNNRVQLTNLRLLSTLDDNVLPGNILHGKDQTEANVNFAGEYSFNEAPGAIRNGDSFSVDIPSPLKLEDAELPLVDTNSNETLGKVVASSATGKITFTFNEKVEDKHHIHGTFKVSAKQTVTNEDKTIVYTLPNGKTQSITYKVLKATNQNVKGETVYKAGYDGGNMNYWVRVNRSKKDLSGKVVKIKDFFDTSKGSLATYIEKSFSLKEAVYTEESTYEKDLVSTGKVYKVTTDAAVYKADPDNTALLTFTNSKTGFDLLLPTNTGTKSFLLEYSSTSPQDTTKLYNSVGMEIDNEAQPTWTEWAGKKNTETTHVKDLKSTKAIGATITADLAGKVKILKYDEGDASVVLSGVQFDIKKENGEFVETITTNEKGIAVSGLLPDGKYIAKEKVAKDGYKLNEKEYPFEIDSAKEKANKKNTSTLNIPNKRKTIDFEATKVWKNGVSSDYKEVKLGLYVHKEGEDASNAKPVTGSYTPTVTSANGVYTYRWTDQLPERNLDGSKLVYSVRELQEKTDLPLETGDKVTVGERNYVVSYNNAKTEVINTYEVPKTKITANKIWEGGQSEVRPTLFFKLYRSINGVEEEVKVDNKEVPKINGSVEWTDLPKTTETGSEYTYSVKEVDDKGNILTEKTAGYSVEKTDNLTIKNKYSVNPLNIDIAVSKELSGNRLEKLKQDEFEFILKSEDGREIQKVRNSESGEIVFRNVNFTEKGTYNFVIVEVNGGKTINGVRYDNKEINVTVKVTDDGKGNLTSEVSYPNNEKRFINEYTPAEKTSVTLGAKKVLEGKTLEEGKYSFELKDEKDKVLQTVTNKADGTISFAGIEYDESQVGTHKYKISEVAGNEPGITYDKTVYEVEVSVTKDTQANRLNAMISKTPEELKFTNQYTPAEKTSVTLGAKKVLEGKTLEEGKYSFELKDEKDKVLQTVTSKADGTISFAGIEYDESQVGTHKYKISEVAGNEPGITYDKTVYEVEVSVTKDTQTNRLNATISKTPEELKFTNQYTPAEKTSVTLGAKKVLEGKTLEEGKYSFELKDEKDKVLQTVTNKADGTISFAGIEYDESQVGTHKYKISEVAGNEPGITYDKTVYEVEVSVTKDTQANRLNATISKTPEELKFTNQYTPAEKTSVTLGAKKVLEGKTLEEGKYSFELKDEKDKVLQTVTNKADGTISFAGIEYDESQVGTHKYKISEVAGNEPGITYDKTVYEVEVSVTKDTQANRLNATISKTPEELKFTNQYTPAEKTSVTLGAKKVLEGKTLEEGKYSFELKDEKDKVLQTVTSKADGTISFAGIEYDESQVGTHKYKISEVAGNEPGITYDKTVYEVEVSVTKDTQTNRLNATISKTLEELKFTNQYTPAEKTSVTLGAKKVLEGKTLEEGKYSFELKDEKDKVLQTVTSKADGTISFAGIEYDESQVGTHKYKISEVAGNEPGITYDKTVYEVEVSVTKDTQTNRLNATISKTPEELKFTNQYTPAEKTSVTLGAKKVLEGKTLEEGKYSFELKDEKDKVLQTVTNKADGTISFAGIEYDESQVGTHKYKISEVAGNEPGITYDKTVYEVEVSVTKDTQTNRLNATISKTPEELKFTNQYTPAEKTSVTLGAKKVLEGKTLEEGKYSFELKDEKDKVLQTVTNKADGTISFAGIEYDESQVGTHKYKISEVAGNEPGITYDKTVYEVEVSVTKDTQTNRLNATISKTPEELKFTNQYTPAEKTSVTLGAKKVLEGKTLEEGKYSFELKDEKDKVLQTVTNKADGTISFAGIEYDESQVGTHKYKISEVAGNEPGITYDKTVYEVEVSVTKDTQANRLNATISKTPEELKFTNQYTPAEKTSVTLGAKKVLEGKTLEEGKYSFELKDEKDKVLQTVTNKADGTISFAGIEYDESQVGTHKYKISEVAGNEPGITYDKTVYEVEVSVTKDTQANRLNATISKTPEELKFTNQYTPAEKTSVTLGAKKVLEGKTLEEGKYSFELKDEKDKVLQTVTNKADGTISFAGIEYDESQVGTHKYKISEVAGNEPGITYDKTVYEVEVSVTKDTQTNRLNATISKTPEELKFTNTFVQKMIDIPVTKVWNDNNNNDGKRPNNVEVELLENGSSTGKKLILSSENNWKGSFQNLVAEKDGKAINYSVVEVATNGYQASVTGDVNTGYTITNSYSNETVNIKAVKNWDDGNNQDGKRPSEIKINLLADGKKVETKTVKADQSGKWEVSFTGKPKYKDGKEIKYTITEEAVNEYTTTITDFNVVNKYVPKVVEFQVTKIWDDANNQDGKRPSTIQVQLYKSIEGSVETPLPDKILTLEEKGQNNPNKWTGIFTNLPKYENGKEVSYSVKEINVPEGYVSNVVGKEITNSHTPEEIVIEGTKVWNDNNNQDGKRSKIIRVQILNGEKVVDEIEVSEKTNWTFKSKSLPKYENGKEIKYAVKEMEVKTYSTDISKDDNGKYTITNTHEPEKISLQGQKIWDDMNNIDQIRPVSITVKLYANGEDTGKTATVTENNGWRYEFSNLDKYKDGKLITYSVKEVNIPNGYEVEENGMNIINHHKPNKPKDPEPNKPKDPEPNKPKDPEPNKPKDPEPNKPKNPEPKTINPDKSRELDNNKKLPLTGSESGNSLLGLILLGVGTSLVAYKRRKED